RADGTPAGFAKTAPSAAGASRAPLLRRRPSTRASSRSKPATTTPAGSAPTAPSPAGATIPTASSTCPKAASSRSPRRSTTSAASATIAPASAGARAAWAVSARPRTSASSRSRAAALATTAACAPTARCAAGAPTPTARAPRRPRSNEVGRLGRPRTRPRRTEVLKSRRGRAISPSPAMAKKKKEKAPEGVELLGGRSPRVTQDYDIEERIEAGMVRQGSEVNALRAKRADIEGAYAALDPKGELYLHKVFIGPYEQACPYHAHPERRVRKLLLHKKELKRLR